MDPKDESPEAADPPPESDPDSPGASESGSSEVDRARRRLLRLALYVPPAVLGTFFTARPAIAQTPMLSCGPAICVPSVTCSPAICTPGGLCMPNTCGPDLCSPNLCAPVFCGPPTPCIPDL